MITTDLKAGSSLGSSQAKKFKSRKLSKRAIEIRNSLSSAEIKSLKKLFKISLPVTGKPGSNGTIEGKPGKEKNTQRQSRALGQIASNFDLLAPIFNKTTGLPEQLIKENIRAIVSYHNHLIKQLGIKRGTEHWKEITSYCVQLLEGNDPALLMWVSCGKVDRWPRKLAFLRPLYHDITRKRKWNGKLPIPDELKLEYMRYIVTLFKLNRCVSDYSELSLGDITAKFDIPSWIIDEFKEFVDSRVKGDRDVSKFDIKPIFGSANGPNGVPKLGSSSLEAVKLLEDPKLSHHFKTLCQLTDNADFLEYLRWSCKDFDVIDGDIHYKGNKTPLTEVTLRKLVAVPDSGNKSRTVAIVDFWTQCLLGPLEEDIKSLIRKEFPESSAFYSHAQGVERIKNNWSEDLKSIDASNWTENFPAKLQFIVISKLYGMQFAIAWQALAVTCTWHSKDHPHPIQFGKGQGMGTKGSFIIASYTQHLFVEFVYHKYYGKTMFYQSVGDDLVVTDPDSVFGKLFETIGVKINLAKCKGSTPNGVFAEFVSRSLWEGKEYSLLSPKLVSKTIKQAYLIPTMLGHVRERCDVNLSISLEDILSAGSKPGISEAKRQAHIDQTVKVFEVYQVLTGNQILTTGDRWDKSDILLILRELLILTGETLHEIHGKDPEERFTDIWDQVSEFNNVEEPHLWQFLLEHGIDLVDAKVLLFANSVFKRSEELSEALLYEGPISLPKLRIDVGPDQLVDSLSTIDATNVIDGLYLNVQLTSLIMDVLAEARSESEKIKILSRFQLLDKVNSKIVVHLFKQVNKCIKSAATRESYDIPFKIDKVLRNIGLSRVLREVNQLIKSAEAQSSQDSKSSTKE